jgi:pimeloyl-ACP methyl ester carboxylesterase
MIRKLVLICLWAWCSAALSQQATRFEIELDASAVTQPISGRLLLFLSQHSQTPINGPNWFSPEPFFGMEVKDFAPGQRRIVDDSADGFPGRLSELTAGQYIAQAILDQDFYHSNHAAGPGNVFSTARKIQIGPESAAAPIHLKLDQTIPPFELVDTKWLKFIKIHSQLLRDFHGREVIERAAVVLPPSYYDQPQRRFPVYYEITGFGESLNSAGQAHGSGQPKPKVGEIEFIKVVLTGQCKWGHHVYANSQTNGPRGDSLVRELIPHIDQQFRTIADSTARFVGGHSSGGWSSLWLQIQYPESFGGLWSTSPDPVDFRDWQGTNLYAQPPSNVFFEKDGKKKPLARVGTRPVIWYKDFCLMDDVLGRGGQLRSFDAVFSPRQPDGWPAKCWDRATGEVIPSVVEHWRKYDISLLLEQNWSELQPKLAGKLHIYMGELDTFYLEGATKLLAERLKSLGSDAQVEIFPGKDHGTVLTPQLRHRIAREMAAKFHQHHPDGTSESGADGQ